MASFLTEPVPHTEGADALRAKPALTRRAFDEILPDLRGRAFTVTGVEAANSLQAVRDTLAELPEGGDWEDLKGRVLDEISPWLVTSDDPEERAKQEGAAERRAELLLRMHGWQAYAATQHRLLEAHVDSFPYRQYLTSGDDRVRDSHAALDRLILPATSPFWADHTPPWDFNCRCDVVPITSDEADEQRAAEQSARLAPEDRTLVEGPMLGRLEGGERVMPGGAGAVDVRTPRQRQGPEGYEWRPGDLRLPPEQILARYEPEVAAAFRAWAEAAPLEGHASLWAWLADSAPPPAPGAGPSLSQTNNNNNNDNEPRRI